MNIKKIVILGAGISGLALGWFLKNQYGSDATICILEKSSQVGGRIQTIHCDGFLTELGPHSCRTKGNGFATLQLIEELNLQSEVILPDANARQKYLYLDGKLQATPHNLWSFLFSPMMKGVPQALCRDFFAASGSDEDESIAAFCERRFGKVVTQRLIDPLITGIYAGDIHQLSVQACFPQWKQGEQQYGSVLMGMLRGKSSKQKNSSEWIKQIQRAPFYSFCNGLSTLTQALELKLQENIIRNCTITYLDFRKDGVTVCAADGSKWEADHIYSTIPSGALAALMVAHRPALSILLQKITFASVATASFGYKEDVLKHKGFGYLIPSKENEKALGMIWDSSVFPQQNQENETRITVIMGGAHYPQLVSKEDSELKEIALDTVRRHLNINSEPMMLHINRAYNAIPQYKVGHKQLVERIQQSFKEFSPHITVLGSAFNGVSINDCVYAAHCSVDFSLRSFKQASACGIIS